MPYEGDRLSMLVALPDDRDGIADLESAVTADMIDGWNKRMASHDVVVSMPKFTMETGYDLAVPLAALGASDMFYENVANLTGIRDPESLDSRNLYVSKAIHNAFVDVNEEGTEAAAVTTIVVSVESEPLIMHFTADHPFLFFIQDDESGTILFMGRVLDPVL